MQKKHNLFFSNWLFLVILIFSASCTQKKYFQPKNGDLLFQDLDSSPLCDAIEKVTKGVNDLPFSHVGMVVIVNDVEYVLEAFVNGVDTIDLHSFLNRSLNAQDKPKVVVGRLQKHYEALIPKAIKYGMKLIGKKYDEEFNIDNNTFYCSELIYDIFLKANNNKSFFYLSPMTYKEGEKTMPIWVDYFNNLGISIPENEPGINPGGISLSKKINIIYNYAK